MSLIAVCPRCQLHNSPMNTRCDVCQAPLPGGALVDDALATGGSWSWALTSMLITTAIYVPLWGLGVHTAVLTMAMFYGPLLASFFARDNVVWKAALGGVFGLATIIVLAVALRWSAARAAFTVVVGGTISGDGATKAAIALFFGIPLVFLAILPLCLIGASVGEHLSVWRRRRFSPPVEPPAPEV